ncbi:MAG: hypothetical protein R2850_09350 [Bacteroidia bacterium]
MNPKHLIIFCLLLIQLECLSQKDNKRIKLSEISLQTGLFLESNTTASLEQFKNLAPQSTILESDLTEYSQSISNQFNGFSMNSLQAGFVIKDKKSKEFKNNRIFKIGITQLRSAPLSSAYHRFSELRYDTLISSSTGQVLFLDSMITQFYTMNYTSSQIRLDLALVFSSSSAARLGISGGVGITAGTSFNSGADITYVRSARNQETDQYGEPVEDYVENYSHQSQIENVSSGNCTGASVYLPLSASFRIGEKENIWNKLHVFCEFRPGVNFSFIPGIRTIANGSAQVGFGLNLKV